MRLLNTSTLRFSEYYKPPKYAILSHRWRDEEVSYEDFDLTCQPQDLVPPWLVPRIAATKSRAGYQKILASARVARESGYEWCWVDTCCIDKRSSAELSEAINSMWKWYEQAELCFVYLDDVAPDSHIIMRRHFAESEWWRRCWTLQELLAPYSMVFCASDWSPFMRLQKTGWIPNTLVETTAQFERKDDGDDGGPVPGEKAMQLLIEASSIPRECLGYYCHRKRYSVAARMSWASRRHASRAEDVAYSLLGLFGINMPLVYGEGRKAFNRLQQEIVRSNPDESIFAWRGKPDLGCHAERSFSYCCDYPSLLAQSPAFFQNCGGITQLDKRMPNLLRNEGAQIATKTLGTRPSTHSITNRGIALRAGALLTWQSDPTIVRERQKDGSMKQVIRELEPCYYYIMYLRCWDAADSRQCALVLQPNYRGDERYRTPSPQDTAPLYHHMGSAIDVQWRVRACGLHFSPHAQDYDGHFDLDFRIQDADTVLYAPIVSAFD